MVKKFSIVSFVMVMLILGARLACAQEFSADMVSTMEGKTMTTKVYASPEKVRMEMPKDMTMIVRKDKNVSWMIMPSEKKYMENSIDFSKMPKVSKNFEGEVERASMGTDTVNGQPVEKFKVTYTNMGKSISVYQWLKDGQFPVKIEAIDGSWSTEYKNISTASIPADMFEPPAGFEKIVMPDMSSMMKGMGGMKGMDMKGMNLPDVDTDKVKDVDVDGMMKSLKGMIGK